VRSRRRKPKRLHGPAKSHRMRRSTLSAYGIRASVTGISGATRDYMGPVSGPRKGATDRACQPRYRKRGSRLAELADDHRKNRQRQRRRRRKRCSSAGRWGRRTGRSTTSSTPSPESPTPKSRISRSHGGADEKLTSRCLNHAVAVSRRFPSMSPENETPQDA
jgi:hypothetical protein